jgi:hypothetical protein
MLTENVANSPGASTVRGMRYATCLSTALSESDVGLFGVVHEAGVIENVGVVNGNVTGYNNAWRSGGKE